MKTRLKHLLLIHGINGVVCGSMTVIAVANIAHRTAPEVLNDLWCNTAMAIDTL